MNTTTISPARAGGLKAHVREALLPIYNEHATYLLRALRTASDAGTVDLDAFAAKIPAWCQVATCHEVAINSATGLDLETHQNPRGKEAEYTYHAKAKAVGRDTRVKIIWYIIATRLAADPALATVEPYADLDEIPRTDFACPFCGHVFATEEFSREVVGYHGDGTAEWSYQSQGVAWTSDGFCDHWFYHSPDSASEVLDAGFEAIIDEIREIDEDLSTFDIAQQMRQYGRMKIQTVEMDSSGGTTDTFYFASSPGVDGYTVDDIRRATVKAAVELADEDKVPALWGLIE